MPFPLLVIEKLIRRRSHGPSSGPSSGLSAGLVAALLIAPTACAETAETRQLASNDLAVVDQPLQGQAIETGTSLAGQYLAGRHAQAERDLDKAAGFLLQALEQDPENLDLVRRAFVVLVVEGRSDEALPLAEKLVANRDDVPIARYAVAIQHLKEGRFGEAVSSLEGLETSGIGRYLVPLISAWSQFGEGNGPGALKALGALKANRGSTTLHDLHAGLIHMALGNLEAAGKALSAATSDGENTDSIRLIQIMGAYFERAGEPKKALALYENYLAEHPLSELVAGDIERVKNEDKAELPVKSATEGVAEALFGVAGSIRQQNAQETALVFGRLAQSLRPDLTVNALLVADILEQSGRLEAANGVYATVKEGTAFSWAARLRIANNLSRLERADEAIELFEAMADERDDSPEPLIDLGDTLRSIERFEEAAEAYERAFDRIERPGPEHWSLFYARGITYERTKRWDEAEADFLQALEYQPDQPYVLNYLGYSWVEMDRNLERAEGMIRRAVELRPNDGYIVDSLGWVYYQLGRFEEAVVELEKAVELRPADPVINDHLGDAYWRVGRLAEARFQWRRALGLEPEDDVATKIEAKLKRGLGQADVR
ncbi:MAG: tetratricopeptide repeat protein [Magnetovibrionaceae bacterium]